MTPPLAPLRGRGAGRTGWNPQERRRATGRQRVAEAAQGRRLSYYW